MHPMEEDEKVRSTDVEDPTAAVWKGSIDEWSP